MGSRGLVLVCALAVIFMIAYAGEAARDVHSKDATQIAHKGNGIEDAKYGGGGYPGGGYPGRGGYPGGGPGGYPGRGGYPGGGYPGSRGNSCRFGCCGHKDYYGNCQRCCPPRA